MALPPTSECRGVAAAIPQPASGEEDICELLNLIAALTLYNRQGPRILYREPNDDQDIVEAVYRWDHRSYQEIFRTGFPPRHQGSTSLEDYYNLERHVNGGGVPADTSPADGSVFVSTTRLANWRPRVTTNVILYRYEIFAPGGIDAVLTLGEHNNFPNQQEIAFAGGISWQYIRSARAYEVTGSGTQFPSYTPHGNRIWRNGGFNPNPTRSSGQTTDEFMIRLRNVVCPRRGEFLINFVPDPHVKKRNIDTTSPTEEEEEEEAYVDPACNVAHYIECAFNFNDQEEAFLFTTDQCLQINYAPGTTDDLIIKEPMSIGDFFPSLRDTIFATGIDAAFTSSSENEAYIFRSNIYALINFVRGDIIQGPKKITDSFYSLKNTIFEHGIDAAFASSRSGEAYIFKGDQYALIYFAPGTTNDYLIQPPKKITLGFPSFKDTVFQDGLDAAFSARATNEAYVFKGNTYALINYAPGTTDDYIINHVTPITDGFHSLRGVIPRYPCSVWHYIECAFNFNKKEEAFLFTTDQCLQINYAPGTTEDYIIKGPMSIGDFFPSLRDTIFASGIDAAFTSSSEDEVYIFTSNIYALINFVSGDIIQGPKKITDSFYSLKNTIFEHGIDAAFASSRSGEAYIFKGDQYALIYFAPGTTDDYLIQPPKEITLGFPSFRDTVFQDGIDAAFSARATNEAYVFKGNTYALINYAPGTTDDYIINHVSPITVGFHSLRGFIPRYSCGC